MSVCLLDTSSVDINDPTGTFTILSLQDQENGEFYLVQKRRAMEFESQKLWKAPSGILSCISSLQRYIIWVLSAVLSGFVAKKTVKEKLIQQLPAMLLFRRIKWFEVQASTRWYSYIYFPRKRRQIWRSGVLFVCRIAASLIFKVRLLIILQGIFWNICSPDFRKRWVETKKKVKKVTSTWMLVKRNKIPSNLY